MTVSQLDRRLEPAAQRGPRARTRKLMLETAIALMQQGQTPSISDVAEASGVSRATAYRYFPSQASLVHAAVDAALGPILEWDSTSSDAGERVQQLLDTSMPRILAFEATFKAALKLSLEQWAKRQAGTLGDETPFTRGHRVEMLRKAISPLQNNLGDLAFERLAKALSLVYGLEVLLVLKDIWGLDFAEARGVAEWAAQVLVRASIEEAESGPIASET